MTLFQFLNQHSFLVTLIVVLGAALLLLYARRPRRRFWLMWSLALLIALAVFFSTRTTPARAFESAADVEQSISTGTPTLVEFFSNY